MNIKADIITIGDEILIGQIVDTNSAWIGRELNKIGIWINEIISISDKVEDIKNTLKYSLSNSDIVLITGGLGPTNDDITKKTLCEIFDSELVIHSEALANVEKFIKLRNGQMSPSNYEQALLPHNADFVPNTNGTASGMWFSQNGKHIIAMPGVPHEMTQMMSKFIIPKLQTKYSLPYILHKNVLISGIAEAKLAETLTDWENNLHKSIKLAYLPSPGLVKLRFSISGNSENELNEIIELEIEKLKLIIPDNIVAETEVSMEEIVAKALKEKGLTISTAESCTGGNISHKLTSVPGSSEYFKGGVVAYSNEIKEKILNVPAFILEKHGAVSKETVTYMANNVKLLFNTNLGIAISGIAGPDGGTEDKPVGTVWIAISDKLSTQAFQFKFGNERTLNIFNSTQSAMSTILKKIKMI